MLGVPLLLMLYIRVHRRMSWIHSTGKPRSIKKAMYRVHFLTERKMGPKKRKWKRKRTHNGLPPVAALPNKER